MNIISNNKNRDAHIWNEYILRHRAINVNNIGNNNHNKSILSLYYYYHKCLLCEYIWNAICVFASEMEMDAWLHVCEMSHVLEYVCFVIFSNMTIFV